MPKANPPGFLIGGFSQPSKMPHYSWSISALGCQTGGILHGKAGSVCEKCYARKGFYQFPAAKKAMARRETIWQITPRSQWVQDFAAELKRVPNKAWEFRWFDSGDLRSYDMLKQIVDIAVLTPHIKHWLPTKEYAYAQQAKREQLPIPANLVIRVSAPMIDGPPAKWWPTTSTVSKDASHATCPAPQQFGKCGACRQCWNPAVQNVVYAAH